MARLQGQQAGATKRHVRDRQDDEHIQMTWDYRVLRTQTGAETFYAVHEVYYKEDGTPDMATVNDIALHADTATGMALSLPIYLKALTLPVLDSETLKEIEPPISAQALRAS